MSKTPQEHVKHLVDDFCHDVLDDEIARQVKSHCAECDACGQALDEARRRAEALRSLPPSEASEKLVQSTITAIEAARPSLARQGWKHAHPVFWVTTAAAALFIAYFHYTCHHLAPTPYDLRVMGQDTWMPATSSALHVALFDRDSGEPMAGIPVTVEIAKSDDQQWVRLASFTTGDLPAQATHFDLPGWEDGRYPLRITAQTPGTPEVVMRSVQLRRQWRLMLSTDKPVYQPGQTIHLRALALRRPDLKPISDQEVIFTIADPKGNVVFKQTRKSSRFGISAADCPLARQLNEGNYQINCQVGSVRSQRTVRVEPYVLPKFRLNVNLERPYYMVGDKVQGTIDAKYFFGRPLAKADVKIEAQEGTFLHELIYQTNAKTDELGKLDFSFTLPPRMVGTPQQAGNGSFRVIAQVTDSAGQTQTTASQRLVAAQAIQLHVIAESGNLVRNVPNRVFIYATYPDGEPAKVSLNINGTDSGLSTDTAGLATFEVTPQTDNMSFTIRASDDQNRTGRKNIRIASGVIPVDFIIRPDRAVYAGGETVILQVVAGSEPVFVDLLKDGQTVLSKMVTVQGGAGSLEFDLPTDIVGAVRIAAFRFDRQGLAVRKSRTIFVTSAQQLKIEARFDKSQYRPGDKAHLDLKITDDSGKPVPGAISLAAVDEAVFHVLKQSAGSEQQFFTLEEQLLKPVYTIYPFSPFEPARRPTSEQMAFDNAIFSATVGVVAGRLAAPINLMGFPSDQVNNRSLTRQVNGQLGAAFERGRSPHSLEGETYSAKAQETAVERRQGLDRATRYWAYLVLFIVAFWLATLALFYPRVFLVLSGVLLLLVVLTVTLYMFLMMGAKSRFDSDTAVKGEMKSEAKGGERLKTDARRSGGQLRVRDRFPETLLWQPELITDDQGNASLDIELADSITTWRLSASAVSAGGNLGSIEQGIKVFQPFFVDANLPVALTRLDEVSVPVVVYNYADHEQTVQVTVKKAPWFEFIRAADSGVAVASAAGDPGVLSINVAAGEVKSIHVPIRVVRVGRFQLEIHASAEELQDAIRKRVTVLPDGRPVETTEAGMLERNVAVDLQYPEDAIVGSPVALLRIHAGAFSQVVQGMESIFRLPTGCFEQTSSSTYPNVLALDYLRRHEMNVPQVEIKARQYIHLGYQRLLTFEINGGGFDWYGQSPAKISLTAYGLQEFTDMRSVFDVDPKLIARTRRWLMSKRKPDGSWTSEGRMFNEVRLGADLNLTAYVANAVFQVPAGNGEADVTLDYLLSHAASSIDSPYTLALVTLAIAQMDPQNPQLQSYVERLRSLCKTDESAQFAWWENGQSATMFHGSGDPAQIETTALATMALSKTNRHQPLVKSALAWLVKQQDSRGTWHSTQATILALKALIGAGDSSAEAQDQTLKLTLASPSLGQSIERTIDIKADQSEVMQQIDLSEFVKPGSRYRLSIACETPGAAMYQLVSRYHTQKPDAAQAEQPLHIELTYDRKRLSVDQHVTAVATVENRSRQPAHMIMLDLPIPGGFVIEPGELDELAGSGTIAKYEITSRQAIIYLRQLDPGRKLELRYRLKATMPIKVQVAPARIYEYYNPARQNLSQGAKFEAA